MVIDIARRSEQQLRDQVRAWLQEHLPKEWIRAVESGDVDQLRRGAGYFGFTGANVPYGLDLQAFLDKQAEAGYAAPTWPTDAYGLGLSAQDAQPVVEELARFYAPRPMGGVGIATMGPTLMQWGTEEQKRTLLWGMLTSREVWCQLFSEPGSGSDMAGASTRAERSGDEWIVNGQKVWTSGAQMAKWGMLVARTDPDVPKHQGLTYFAMDMKSPGVIIRPLRQMTGDAEFNEVFFEDARVPDSMRVGPEGSGWRVATTTLMNERVMLGSGSAPPMPRLGRGPVDAIIERYGPIADPALRDEVMTVWVRSAVLRLTGSRSNMRRQAGAQPGPEGSIGKIAQTELNKRVHELEATLLGAGGQAWEAGDADSSLFVRRFLRSRANSIEGGTSEIQRNILGERVLGLPKDIDVSRDVPWKDVPRSAPSTRR